jgi:hypothetical protein
LQAVTNHDFLTWAAKLGIGFDDRYPESRSLRILSPEDHARFWELPRDPATWTHIAHSILEGLDPWASGYLWPRAQVWPTAADSTADFERVRHVMMRGAEIPDGWTGAVRYDRGETDKLLTVLFVYLAFGWHSFDDLFFIPDHGRQILGTDHHDVIHVMCQTEDRIQDFVEHMREAGYELPTELPDETFRRPSWMENPPD